VTRAAFASGSRNGEEEVRIVLDTWRLDAAASGLDLVAVESHQVLGHVLGGIGQVRGREAVGIAPLSVAPGHQGRGIGSALMRELMKRAETSGWPFVVLLGDPGFYGRFGFERAADYGLTYAPVGPRSDNFLVRRLRAHPDMAGEFRYCWERN
jgi:putative acetyltransferase